MKIRGIKLKAREGEKGVVAVIVAILLIVFMGVAAMAIDVGYLMVVRNELQNIADGAALAGANTLGRLYTCNGDLFACTGQMPYADQLVYEADVAAIRSAILDVATHSRAGGVNGIAISDGDIVVGEWNGITKVFTPGTVSPDAVRVTVRRDAASGNGPITTFFARVLGINTVNLSATATAALTGESTKDDGGLPLPVGISRAWFQIPRETYCNQDIKFYPTGTMEGCAGWHTYEDSPANANRLRRILDGLRAGTYTSPETTAFESVFNFTGGTVASAFDEMKALFDYMKSRDDDNNPETWTTSVVVYDLADCSNPHGDLLIVGFATVVVHTVLTTPEKTIVATVLCDNVEPGRGGGGEYGTKGDVPGLVQ